MCQAIIRVQYPKKDYQDVMIESDDEMKEKIAALEDNTQVVAYTVFIRQKKMLRKAVWEELP